LFGRHYGRLPERPMGADCKSVGFTFSGSNPLSATSKVMGLLQGAHFFWPFVVIASHISRSFFIAVYQPKLGRKTDTRHQLRLMSDINE
jgi:hypothetical protein